MSENMDNRLNALIRNMMDYDAGDAKRIQHFMKVHYFSYLIGTGEGLDAETRFVLETAAVVHDIGIHLSEQKYGVSDGKHQEQEGPAEARALLEKTGGYTPGQIERVCWLVGHHHTYHDIGGIDHQILVEADFLVNLYEDGMAEEAVRKVRERIFRTATGIRLLDTVYLSDSYSFKGCIE
jgi:uncharacterized protein